MCERRNSMTSSKKLLVLGATGSTGQHVVSQAVSLGHDVTAFVRNPAKLTTKGENLRLLTGSLTDARALSEAVRGQDIVVSTLGVGNSLKSHGIIQRSVPAILRAMESHGVRRLIFMSSFGVGATRRDVPLLARVMIRVLLRDLYDDKEAGEEVLHRSSLDWTVIYPTSLTNGPRTGRYRAGERLTLRGFPRISRADVAAFLLSQIEDATYVRKGVLITG